MARSDYRHSDDPGNHSPCYNTDGGRTFTISDGCVSTHDCATSATRHSLKLRFPQLT